MSILDKAQPTDINDSIKEIMAVLKDVGYTDDFLEKITDLSPDLINNMVRTQYKQKVIKDRFNTDIDYNERILKPKMRKLVSKNRGGRGEMERILGMQISQVFMHPQNALNRLLGK